MPAPEAVSSAAESSKRGFIEISGNSFKGKLDAAVLRGRSGTRPQQFWLGYSFAVRTGWAYKAKVANPDSSGRAGSFDGPVPRGSALETHNLAVFLLYRAGSGAIEQVALLNLDRQQHYEGHPVYWLGRAETGDSLSLLERLVASDQSGRISDKAIAAIALHSPSGGATANEDQSVSILTGIAGNHPVEARRQLALNWLRQISGERARDSIKP